MPALLLTCAKKQGRNPAKNRQKTVVIIQFDETASNLVRRVFERGGDPIFLGVGADSDRLRSTQKFRTPRFALRETGNLLSFRSGGNN